jgi:DNA invertase Pin-like site-specific DNA recombinase
MTAAINAEANDTAMRAALYLRVSTGRQAEADLSIPDQRRQVLAFLRRARLGCCDRVRRAGRQRHG